MFFPLIFAPLVVLAVATPAFGQMSRQSTLRLEVRSECALLETVVEQEPGAEEGLMRFRYAARTGPLGGRLEVRLWEGAGAATITVAAGAPAQARPAFPLAASESEAAAWIPPRSHTAREGAVGEVRWRWRTGAQPTDSKPLITIHCP